MKYLIILGALTFAGSAFATELTTDTVLGTDIAEIKSNLTSMGYQVRKSELEDGNIEVYIVKDASRYEVYVSSVTGKVIRLKTK